MIRIVLDTNVLVSALLSPFHAPGQIVGMLAAGLLQLLFDARILAEYEAVLARPKFSLDPQGVDVLLRHIETNGILVAAKPLPFHLPDRGDEPFLETALSAQADFLVTGNVRHFPAGMRKGVKVVNPSDFLKEYAKQESS